MLCSKGSRTSYGFRSCVAGTRSSWMRRGRQANNQNPHNRQDTEEKPREGSERRSSWMRGTSIQGQCPPKERSGETDTEENPREDGRRDGRKAATWRPQKLQEAGRTLPWSLCREHRGCRGPAPQNVAPKQSLNRHTQWSISHKEE